MKKGRKGRKTRRNVKAILVISNNGNVTKLNRKQISRVRALGKKR